MNENADVMLILNSHIDYLGRIEDYMNGKIPDPQAAAYDRCKLGSWYYAVTDARLREHPEFGALGERHKTFHAVTDEAIADFRAGNRELAQQKVGQAFLLFGQISNKLMTIDASL